MNKYKYKFSKLIVTIGIIGVFVAVACSILGVYRFLKLYNDNIEITLYNYLTLAIVIIFPILYIVIAISALINSYYVVTDTQVVLKWGVISNKFNLSDIKEVKLLTNTSKLELVFNDDTYFTVVTDGKWFESFVDDIKAKKPNISYIVITEPSK